MTNNLTHHQLTLKQIIEEHERRKVLGLFTKSSTLANKYFHTHLEEEDIDSVIAKMNEEWKESIEFVIGS